MVICCWNLFTYRDLRHKWSTIPITAPISIWCTPFDWCSSILINFTLTSIQRNMVIKIWWRCRYIWIINSISTVVMQRFIFVISGWWPLKMIIQVNRSRWSLRMIMLMASAVNCTLVLVFGGIYAFIKYFQFWTNVFFCLIILKKEKIVEKSRNAVLMMQNMSSLMDSQFSMWHMHKQFRFTDIPVLPKKCLSSYIVWGGATKIITILR